MIVILLIIITSIFFTGIIVRSRSIMSGRKGPGILQPLKNLFVLFRKGNIYSSSTSIIFQIAPIIIFSSILTASLMIPFGNIQSLLGFNGDILLFSYLIALSRFMIIIAAIDTGSSFEGMGAAREGLFSLLIEPAFFILIASLCMLTGYTSFNDIFMQLQHTENYNYIIGFLSFFVFANIALIENSRLPVDDPKTHLELTMIHEVMVLDTSGFDLALIQLASFLKFAIYGTFISSVIVPYNLSITVKIVLYVLIQIIFAFTIGFIESFRARYRMNRNPQYILTITSVSLVIFVVVLILNNII